MEDILDLKDILWKNPLNHWEYNLNKLIKLVECLSIKCTGKEQLCKMIGVYRDFLDRLEEKHNIKINYNFTLNKTDPKFKAIYQDYDWCYQKYMIEGLNHDEMAKEAKSSKRVVEKWCTEKHRLTQEYRRIHKQLNDIQKDLIIGSLLGDGHIDKRETQPIFIVCHAINQKDYLFWKYNILKDLCNIKPTYYKEKLSPFPNGKYYLCKPYYRISTRIYDCFYKYREMSKRELIDNLNEFSLSIFALDDGYRSNSNWEICLADISLDDREYFVKYIKNKFNLNSYVCNYDNRYIKLTADASRKLDDIILKNIPSDLDIIQYKIINNNITQKQERKEINYKNNTIYLSDFCKQNNLNYKYIWELNNKINFKNGEEVLSYIK